jgi:hypothetical protein
MRHDKGVCAGPFIVAFGLVLLGALPAGATITVVQHSSASTGNNTSLARAFTQPNTAGNLLVVAISTYAGETINAPTDSLNNTYVQAVTTSQPGNAVAAIYYAPNCKGGANTVTAHISASDNIHLHVYEISGIATSSPVDVAGTATVSNTTSLTVSTTSATTSPNDYVFAYFGDNNSQETFVAGSGYGDTEQTESSSGDAGFSEDKIVSSVGTQVAAATASGVDPITALIVAFKAASGPPVPVLSLSPAGLTFTATAGGANPATQTINASNTTSGSGSVSFTASSDSPSWLSVSPTSGSATGGGSAVPLTVSATTPAASGTLTGHITVTATGATGSPATVTVTFNVNTVQHSVVTSWTATSGAQYNVYRAPGTCGTSGQVFTKLNSALISSTSFTDSTPVSGATYCYYATAVESGVESPPSNAATVVIPTP